MIFESRPDSLPQVVLFCEKICNFLIFFFSDLFSLSQNRQWSLIEGNVEILKWQLYSYLILGW